VTKKIIPEISMPIMAVMQVLWIIILLGFGMITEPKSMNERETRKRNKKSACGQVFS